MSGKELVLAAIRGKETERVPWVPFVGCHAASLLGISARELLQSAERIVEGQVKAAELYLPDGLPVTFDLQIEAEVLGCKLQWADENPPAVVDHLSDGSWRTLRREVSLDEGRIPLVLEATRRLRRELPDLALYGLVTGPFTLAMHLAGAELFMEMYDNPEGVKDLIAYCGRVAAALADGYLDAGADIVALVDPMTSQIGPDQFADFAAPACREIFDHVRGRGAASSFFVCGHAQKNIVAMAETKPDNISIDENIPLKYVRGECLKREVSFGGNMRLTTVMLMGRPEDNAAHALTCMEVGGNKGFVLAPGCDIPYAVPAENIRAIARVVRDPYEGEAAKKMIEGRVDGDEMRFDMSEYGRSDKVIVDVITLDSEACAPCQYMVESVKAVAPMFEDLVIWREHKIKYRESVAFMTSLMVRNVPTICIDGQIKFVSRIPKREEMIQAIQDRINEKLRIKLRHKRARLTVFADESEEGRKAWENVRRAVTETGASVELERVADPSAALAWGAAGAPAVLLTRHTVKSEEKVPEVNVVKEWLKDLES